MFGPGTFRFPRPAFTPRAKKVIEYSIEEAEAAGWTLRVPLSNGDYAVLSRPFASTMLPMVVAPFVDLLRQTLVEKFPESADVEAAGPAVSLAGE